MPLWVPEWIVWRVGRITCRLLRWHNVTCRGRRDHQLPVTVDGKVQYPLIDPDRWNRFPRQ